MLSSRNECGRESLSLVHRKQFLKARYVSFLRYVPCDSSIGTLESTKNSQKDWKLFDRDGRKFYYTNDFKNDQFQSWDASYEVDSTFEKMITWFMDKQNEKESEARKLLDKIKLSHEKSKMSRLMDRNNTSRRLVYRNRVDMQNKERGARVAQVYADKVQADNDMRKSAVRKMKHSQYGSIKKHHETFGEIMSDVVPEYQTRNINFEKRSNKIPFEIEPY